MNTVELLLLTNNCTNPYKALPYNNNTGCDAMGQNTGYYCGCSMLQKMFYRLGYKVSQSEIARVAGTTTSGTGHAGLETAIAYVGKKFGVKFNAESAETKQHFASVDALAAYISSEQAKGN